MALGNWTQYLVGSPTVEINTITPIYSIGSLRMSLLAQEKVLLVSNTYTLGLTKGVIQSLFRVDGAEGTDPLRYGFTFFQSATDILASGSCYMYGIEITDPFNSDMLSTPFFDICIAGLDEGRHRYFSGTSFSSVDGYTIIALEVEWAYEPVLLGGTRFIFREGHGTLTDFSNLSDIGTVELYPGMGVSNPPLLTTSAAEGIFSSGQSFDSSTFMDVNVDLTEIQSLSY